MNYNSTPYNESSALLVSERGAGPNTYGYSCNMGSANAIGCGGVRRSNFAVRRCHFQCNEVTFFIDEQLDIV